MKTCSGCKQTKLLDQFAKNRSTKDGLQSQCRQCFTDRYKDPAYMAKARNGRKVWREANPDKAWRHDRNGQLKKLYGITLGEYESMHEDQGGLCLICGCSEDEISHSRNRLVVDHCHDTGKIRGLLCTPCNDGLGKFKDDPELVEVAIEYLRGYE